MPPPWVSPPSFLATTPPGVSSIPIWPSVHPVPFNLIASLEYLKLIFIAYWSGLIIGENIMPTWIRPPLCLSVQTASDWGCCFSSCLLYKLIWPETFALLGAERDVMLADTSWRPSPLADSRRSGEVWFSTSQPAVTKISPHRFLTEGRTALDVKHGDKTVCRPHIERAPPLRVQES